MAVKYYAVRKGLKTGIFHTWEECKASVSGYSCAEYKSFPSLEQAREYLELTNDKETMGDGGYVPVYVDGSYNSVTEEFSYGMVVVRESGVETFSQKYEDKELASMRNVAGEIKGAEAAMRFALEHDIHRIAIYHDYEGIAKWCTGEWKTNKEGTKAYKTFYEEVSRKLAVRFVKVTGHSGDKYNDMADKLAREALGL